MKHKDRAYRRHQLDRRRQQVYTLIAHRDPRYEAAYSPAAIGRMVHTKAPCSCWACRPYRWFPAPSRQERRAAQAGEETP